MDFKTQKEYIKNNNKIDMKHFNKVSDVTSMIDLLNKELEDKKEKKSGEEIHSISQFLDRNFHRTTFFVK